ncbi:RHS repeat domain-containing protein [Aquimarina sp. W85]|uniref:RHS repeat domain-containing protein n=1 Tax=Aquimarina rhodophyticola TaxID=3342246 RepID=UPI00366D7C21
MKKSILLIFIGLCNIINAQDNPILPIGDGDCGTNQPIRYYFDGDGDGIGSLRYTYACQPNLDMKYSATKNGDCDDSDPDVLDIPRYWYLDRDRDKDGDINDTAPKYQCIRPIHSNSNYRYSPNNRDCDDGNRNIQQYAWYIDRDGDGEGDVNAYPKYSCDPYKDPQNPTTTYVRTKLDCNDTDELIKMKTWYLDTDGDGFGEADHVKQQCTDPGANYYPEAKDKCPDIQGTANGCPPAGTNVQELWNTIKVTSYNPKGAITGQNKTYFDALGKPVQQQSMDIKTGKTWGSQILYDAQGRPALQTLSAPTNNDIATDFLYRENFFQRSDGQTFSAPDFENLPESPALAGTESNSLGWYYSSDNTTEPYQDATQRPYSRTIYSELNPGTVLKTIGGNKINGAWKNGYVFSIPAGQELAQPDAFNDPLYNTYKVIKTVSRNVHGEENVVFTDTDGNTLAAARSGDSNAAPRFSTLTIGEQGYVDIHIPKGRAGITITNPGGFTIYMYNLITENRAYTSTSLPNGFYRIAVANPDAYNPVSASIQIRYPENYYDYSLNYYDKAGRLVRSKQPLKKLESTYTYNSLGQLEQTTSQDEGTARFLYRKDGQIRYSQNSKQAAVNEVSFTSYDQLTRPIQSGVLTNTLFSSLDPNAALPVTPLKEVHTTQYDSISQDDSTLLVSLNVQYHVPSFLTGNVAKTSNEHTTTYYSYDVYGRVKWIVQNISDIGLKTIDYIYDPVSSQVTQVIYQKGHPTEQFIHRYTYDPANHSLVKVETSPDNSTFTEHAAYTYYENGALKRINLANGLQGIDYVYSLSGALKSINHPSLEQANDPGGDANDLFGMIIDYNTHDFNRPLPNIKSTDYGTDQFNGNIKGIRWNTENPIAAGKENVYTYEYNRNNWLTQAEFGEFTGDYSSVPTIQEDETGTAAQNTITTTQVFHTGYTYTYTANVSIVMKPGFHAKRGSNITAKISGSKGMREVNAGSYESNATDDYKVDQITYDANGNIQSLHRNKHTEAGNNSMDQLSYTYKTDKPNQLLRVDDAITAPTNADDIKDQTGDVNGENYKYNTIGQLVENIDDKITYLYNASGLVTEVQKDKQPLVKFFYNDKGHRVVKESYNPINGTLSYTEHYVRDAAGTALAIYRDGQVVENTIYGAGRLGVRKADNTHLYQLTDHLGNVRAVVARAADGTPIAKTATDYYPFGMPMPGRNDVGDYRYAYQGQEKDPETGKEAFQLRLWDARIGRWLTTDPYGQYSSPYLGMGNNPMNGTDPDGGFWQELGNWLGGNGWISNEGLDYLKNNGITNYKSHLSKDVFNPNGYHTVSYDNSDGELTFHSFKNVNDLRVQNVHGFKLTAGAQAGFDFLKSFRIDANIFAVELLSYDSNNGWYNTFDSETNEFKMDFLNFGIAYSGLNLQGGFSLTKIKNKGLGHADFSGNIQGGYSSFFQFGYDFNDDKPLENGYYNQNGMSLEGKAIIGIELYSHSKVHHGKRN